MSRCLRANNRHLLTYLLISALVLYCQPGQSWGKHSPLFQKHASFLNISKETGLSHPVVNVTLQDSAGFFWLGTNEGLNRFDGYHITRFLHAPNKETSLPRGKISALTEDKDGNIWIGIDGFGLASMNSGRTSISRHHMAPVSSGKKSALIISGILEVGSNKLLIGTNQGLYSFDTDTRKFQTVQLTRASSESSIRSLFAINDHMIGVATDRQVMAFTISDLSHKEIVFEATDGDEITLAIAIGDHKYAIATRASGVILVDTGNGIVVDRDSLNELQTRLGDSPVTSLVLQRESLWIGSRAGLFELDLTEPQINHIVHIPTQQDSLLGNHVISLFVDRDDMLWVGLIGGGLNRLNQFSSNFAVLGHEGERGRGLNEKSVWGLHQDAQDNLWVGTYSKGVNMLSSDGQTIRHFEHQPDNEHSIREGNVFSITQDNTGVLWFGTSTGVSFLLPGQDTFRHLDSVNPLQCELDVKMVLSIAQDRRGHIWFGTYYDGAYRLNKETCDVTHFIAESINPRALPHPEVTAILNDKSGDLWLGTWGGGIVRFDFETDSFTRFQHDPALPDSLSNDGIVSTYQDNEGNLWLGTSKGLNRFNLETQSFDRLPQFPELEETEIFAIFGADNNNIWYLDRKSLNYLDLQNGKHFSVGMMEGLPNHKFNFKSHLQTPDGQIYIGTRHGLVSFTPFSPTLEKPESPVITDFKLFNTSVYAQAPLSDFFENHISAQDKISLTRKQNAFSLELAALQFGNPEKNQIAWQLVDFDQQWNYADATNRIATYTNLNPGTYEFLVKASDNLGNWSEVTTVLELEILPAWWETTTAKFIYVLLLILFFIGMHRFRVYRLRQYANQLEGQVDARTTELKSKNQIIERLLNKKNNMFTIISHELKTPLTLMQGPVELLKQGSGKDQEKKLKVLESNIRRLSQMVDQILALANTDYALPDNSFDVGVTDTVFQVFGAFEPLAQQRNIDFVFDAPADLEINIRFHPENFEKVVSNLISNAFKYTSDNGAIKVLIILDGKTVRIAVKDNGRGIAKKDLERIFEQFYRVKHDERISGSGLGLALVRELVNSANGVIEVDSEEGVGSNFCLVFPVDSVVDSQPHSPPPKNLDFTSNLREVTAQSLQSTPDLSQELEQGKDTILVVEDNAEIRNFIAEILTDRFNVVLADNGNDGIQKANDTLPDLIITDLLMPQVSGKQLVDVLKSQYLTSHIPIIVLSAVSDDNSKQELINKLADAYISKPFKASFLRAQVDSLLKIRANLQQKYTLELSNRLLSPEPESIQGKDDNQQFIESFVKSIANCYQQEDVTVISVAELLHMSERQLQRKLKAVAGISFTEYLRNYRLSEAAKAISRGHQITQVCFESGFSSLSYFGRCFKQRYGLTPKQFQSKNHVEINQ